jgi:hypothetical protein
VYRIASITKQFTALALMQLVDAKTVLKRYADAPTALPAAIAEASAVVVKANAMTPVLKKYEIDANVSEVTPAQAAAGERDSGTLRLGLIQWNHGLVAVETRSPRMTTTALPS